MAMTVSAKSSIKARLGKLRRGIYDLQPMPQPKCQVLRPVVLPNDCTVQKLALEPLRALRHAVEPPCSPRAGFGHRALQPPAPAKRALATFWFPAARQTPQRPKLPSQGSCGVQCPQYSFENMNIISSD